MAGIINIARQVPLTNPDGSPASLSGASGNAAPSAATTIQAPTPTAYGTPASNSQQRTAATTDQSQMSVPGFGFGGGFPMQGPTPISSTPALPAQYPSPTLAPVPSVSAIAPATVPTAPKSTSQGYTATPWNVTSDQTVNGQLAKNLDPNNPLNVQAKTAADQASNSRGLLNSSIALSAAQDAMYKTALPIAQQDATTYANSGQSNAAATNTASAFTANAANASAIDNADNQTKALLQSMQSNTSTGVAQLSSQTQLAMNALDNNTKTALTTTDDQYKQLLQTNTSASNLFNQITTNLTNISSSTTMDAAAKQAATDNQLKLLQQGMQALNAAAATNPGDISSLNLGQYFAQATPAPVAAPGIINSVANAATAAGATGGGNGGHGATGGGGNGSAHSGGGSSA